MSLISKNCQKSLRMGLRALVEWEMKCESTFSIFPNVRKIFFSSFTHLLGIAGDDYENILERQKMDIGNFYIYHWKFARKVQSGREKKNLFEMSTVIQNARKSNNICWGIWPTIHSANLLQDVLTKWTCSICRNLLYQV